VFTRILPIIEIGGSIILWVILLIFLAATLFWIAEIVFFRQQETKPIKYQLEDIQVRILTIGGERVVQQTVNSLPSHIRTVKVISEKDIDIEGADVYVVPENFTCKATRKGRAIEWARREVDCQVPFILYLDEDTIVNEFHGLPDSDIVQLSERPIRSGGIFPYLAEIFRSGFQIEMETFPNFRYPLYAWGGGIAVKTELEDKITWNVNSVTEDTNFIWRAFQNDDVEMAFLNVKLMNQAPPTVRELIHQRRRWISGAIKDRNLLPFRYRVLSLLRNTAWGLVFLSPLLLIPVIFSVEQLFYPRVYTGVMIFQIFGLFGWGVIGYKYYDERLRILILLLLTLPLTAVFHSAGAFWALMKPTQNFRVTQKVEPEDIDDGVELDAVIESNKETVPSEPIEK